MLIRDLDWNWIYFKIEIELIVKVNWLARGKIEIVMSILYRIGSIFFNSQLAFCLSFRILSSVSAIHQKWPLARCFNEQGVLIGFWITLIESEQQIVVSIGFIEWQLRSLNLFYSVEHSLSVFFQWISIV